MILLASAEFAVNVTISYGLSHYNVSSLCESIFVVIGFSHNGQRARTVVLIGNMLQDFNWVHIGTNTGKMNLS